MMITVGTAAYKLYSAGARVGSTLSTLSDVSKWITETMFIPPSEIQKLHPQVQCRLDRLVRRMQVVSQPLNYCLLWTQHKGSACAETVHQCKDILKQVHSFLAQISKDKTRLADKEYMLERLDQLIQEIDFCVSALHLQVSLVQTRAMQDPDLLYPRLTPSGRSNRRRRAARMSRQGRHQYNSSSRHGSDEGLHGHVISPSLLLQASNRIQVMHDEGGDVAVCFGQLYKKSFKSSIYAPNNVYQPRWERVYRRATFKIYRAKSRRLYELHIESNEHSMDTDDEDEDEEVRKPRTMKFDLSASLHFTTIASVFLNLENVAIPANAESEEKMETTLDTEIDPPLEDAFAWAQMIANQVQEQFSFVFKSGLDDWDQPLPPLSTEPMPMPPMHASHASHAPHSSNFAHAPFAAPIDENSTLTQSTHLSPPHATHTNHMNHMNSMNQMHHMKIAADPNNSPHADSNVATASNASNASHAASSDVADIDAELQRSHELDLKHSYAADEAGPEPMLMNVNNHSRLEAHPPQAGPKLTASMQSLDSHVHRTRSVVRLNKVILPGGDYDMSHGTPELIAYMVRLCIYENDCDSFLHSSSLAGMTGINGTGTLQMTGLGATRMMHATTIQKPLLTTADDAAHDGMDGTGAEMDDTEDIEDMEHLEDLHEIDEMEHINDRRRRGMASESSGHSGSSSDGMDADGGFGIIEGYARPSEGNVVVRQESDEKMERKQRRNGKDRKEKKKRRKKKRKKMDEYLEMKKLSQMSHALPAHLTAVDEELRLALRNPTPPPIPFHAFSLTPLMPAMQPVQAMQEVPVMTGMAGMAGVQGVQSVESVHEVFEEDTGRMGMNHVGGGERRSDKMKSRGSGKSSNYKSKRNSDNSRNDDYTDGYLNISNVSKQQQHEQQQHQQYRPQTPLSGMVDSDGQYRRRTNRKKSDKSDDNKNKNKHKKSKFKSLNSRSLSSRERHNVEVEVSDTKSIIEAATTSMFDSSSDMSGTRSKSHDIDNNSNNNVINSSNINNNIIINNNDHLTVFRHFEDRSPQGVPAISAVPSMQTMKSKSSSPYHVATNEKEKEKEKQKERDRPKYRRKRSGLADNLSLDQSMEFD